MPFEIAPMRALRFDSQKITPDDAEAAVNAAALVAPPYDIIGPEEHAELLERSEFNISRLTLGLSPGEKEDYRTRGERILEWRERGVLKQDEKPALYVYGCDYTVPGSDEKASFRGVAGLGRLHSFDEGVVLPHESTFPRVVDDRFNLLDATRTHLETIFVLYEDKKKAIDAILLENSSGEPLFSVEGKPGETHSIWAIEDPEVIARLQKLFRKQKPIIADGHHRYTTALLFRDKKAQEGEDVPGSTWQPMVFGNLVGDGLSILATHRLINTGGKAALALEALRGKLEESPAYDEKWDYQVETMDGGRGYRIPKGMRAIREGVAATDYGILHELVLNEWLRPVMATQGEVEASYYKEGSGERAALASGEGDLLFRMRPVAAKEFRMVVQGGEVFPHKTTFFYPKLPTGLVFRILGEE